MCSISCVRYCSCFFFLIRFCLYLCTKFLNITVEQGNKLICLSWDPYSPLLLSLEVNCMCVLLWFRYKAVTQHLKSNSISQLLSLPYTLSHWNPTPILVLLLPPFVLGQKVNHMLFQVYHLLVSDTKSSCSYPPLPTATL